MLDTVPVQHDLTPYLATLKYDGIPIFVGLLNPVEPPLKAGALVTQRRVLGGSLIGGMPEPQRVLDFCAAHAISCDVEMLNIQSINEAYKRVQQGDVRYRFVIDMASLKNERV